MREPISIRVQPQTMAKVRTRARLTGSSQSALVERYIEEGLRRDEHPLIYFRERAGGRRPTIVGTRLDVADVVETIRQNDNSLAEAADYLALPATHVEAATRYYADYADEVDEWLARAREIAEQAEDSWRRRQAIFT